MWYAVAPETACDWSTFYANHGVMTLIDSCQSKMGQSEWRIAVYECDWLKCDVCKRSMMDRCEWANENGESAFWE